jgi:hypothetical protein
MQRHFFARGQSQMRTKPRHIQRDPKLDTEWANWVAENLARGCDPEEILGILLKNNLPIGAIPRAVGARFPCNSSAIERLGVRRSVASDGTRIDYAALSLVRIARLETEAGVQGFLCQEGSRVGMEK